MRTRGPVERTSRPRAVVVPFPGLDTEERAAVARLIPSGRVLALAFTALAAGLLAIVLVRETSVFAVERIEVTGAPPAVVREVERTLADVRGRNLLQLDTLELRDAVERIPTVRAASFDRAFPHGLSVALVAERPVAVIRQGPSSWLVSERGRIMSEVRRDQRAGLPRIWVPRAVQLERGVLAERELMTAVAAVAPLAAARFPARVATVAFTDDDLTLRLRSGLLVRLGEPADVRLKLAVAGRVLPLLDDDTAYLDVSVPERPVSGMTLDSQVEGET
jgi:cell division protein FtsQ